MANQIYNVKQAAKILGLSTNTTYKYLNEGKIKAARGRTRGTFLISTKALEDFLGSKLPEKTTKIQETESESFDRESEVFTKLSGHPETVIEVTPPTLATQIIRAIIAISIIFVIVDILTNPDFRPINQLIRIFFIIMVILVSYQFGGFTKK